MTGSPFTSRRRRPPIANRLPKHVADGLDQYADQHDLTGAERDALRQAVAHERQALAEVHQGIPVGRHPDTDRWCCDPHRLHAEQPPSDRQEDRQ